jgi:dipeptidyl aminopeptidase/acylaminoacyl peptidase
MSEIVTAPYGAWSSPISAAEVAGGKVRLGWPSVIGERVWWQEGRPSESGRVTVVVSGPDGERRDLLAAPWNVRTRVHEYGGRSYLPVASGGGVGIVFANFADQRLYFLADSADAEPMALTPEPWAPAAARYADFTLSPDGAEIWCVKERHDEGKVRRGIVAVPLDGSAAEKGAGEVGGAIRPLVTGWDFFAFPTVSPDGRHLAWISWDHPRMPWDGTELRVAEIEAVAGPVGTRAEIPANVTAKSRLIMGGPDESVLAPLWRDPSSLYVVSDASGWWNLYAVGLSGGAPEAPCARESLCAREEEFAGPLWQLGERPFVALTGGRLAVLHGRGATRLGVLDPGSGELTDLELPYRVYVSGLAADGLSVAAIAGGAELPLSVVRVDAGAAGAAGAASVASVASVQELRRETDSVPDAAYLPAPREVELAGPSGVVYALVYPPANPSFAAPDGELPPYVVWVHGGPTAHVVPLLDVEKAYFTSRGIGVIDVNYGGSTGYGRQYRERLRGQWGVVDVQDAMGAARSLAEAGDADGARLGIRGGSAGGWTALAAVTSGIHRREDAVFAAATSYYGVADLSGFVEQTHDFESRYLDGLIGPIPGAEARYAERAPLGHVTDLTCPVLLLQGLDDPIVPRAQSEAIARDLAAHGIRHAYLAFEGESHGFRKAETIVACLEAELSFYGQIMGFEPPGVPRLELVLGFVEGASYGLVDVHGGAALEAGLVLGIT